MRSGRRGSMRATTTKPVAVKKVNVAPIGKNSKNPIIRLASGGMAVATPKPEPKGIRPPKGSRKRVR